MKPVTMISIDPGKAGAMVLWSRTEARIIAPGVEVLDIVDLAHFVTGKRSFDFTDCVEAMRKGAWETESIPIVIEDVHSSPNMGVGSAFSFGFSACAVQACATLATGAPNVIKYSPQKWKGTLGLWGKPKQASVDRVLKDYPQLSSYLKYKKYHDRAEAVLIGKAYQILTGRQ